MLQANASFSQPVTVKRSATTTTHYSPARPRDKPPLPTTTFRRYLIHHADDDVDDALTRMPATPVTTSVIRSSSVPPRLPARGALSLAGRRHVTRTDSHVVPYGGVPVYEKVVYDSRVTNHPSYPVSSYGHLAVSADAPATATLSLTPAADLAVRQAHRNLDRIDKEIKLTYAHPDGPHRFSSKAYVAEVQPVMVRRSSVRVPSSPSPSDLLLIASAVPPSPTLVLPPPPSPAHHTHYFAAPSVSELQHQMKVDLLKTAAMDAESPVLLHTSVYKQRTEPALPSYSAYVTPRTAYVTTDVIAAPLPPVAPVHVKAPTTTDYAPLPPQPTSVRPKVSETRRKVREVLCKIKKDPHYFD